MGEITFYIILFGANIFGVYWIVKDYINPRK
jgi:hypothetical protein